MKRDIQKFTQQPYDVLVIGGGINGAGIAHIAALNGLKIALLEKGDFAGGTSSKSTKLIHGGLRYLEHFEFGLVRESLKERHIQLNAAPHLVQPMKFIVPVYKTDKRPLWMVRFGVWLYDFLSGKYTITKHQTLSADEICAAVPGIEREGLVGGVSYSDAQMNDARLCLENILSAQEKGAHVANYVEARSLIQENGKAVGVKTYDHLSGSYFEVRAKKIVCAVGPWTNHFMRRERSQAPPQIRTTKGIHVLYKGAVAQDAILIPAQKDNRVFFIIPWMGNSLIGTTDTDYTGDPDDVRVNDEDIDYLIGEAQRVLPHAEFNDENIITAFAGLRPLVYDQGSPEKISRKHVIKESYSGIIYVLGGKYTTYRKIAEEVVSRLTKKLLVNTEEHFAVYGSGDIDQKSEYIAGQYDMNQETVNALMELYGARYPDVLSLVKQDAGLGRLICSCSPVIRAQIVYSVEKEMACREDDIIVRRLGLEYVHCPTGQCRETVRKMLSEMGVND